MKKMYSNPFARLPFVRLFRYTLWIFIFALIQTGCGTLTVSREASSETAVMHPTDTWNIKGLAASDTASIEALSVQFGAQIAIDEINAQGGINGYLMAFCTDDCTTAFRLSASDTSVELLLDPEGLLLMHTSLPEETGLLHDTPVIYHNPEQFIQKYSKMYGTEPSDYATLAYQLIYLLKDLLEEHDIGIAAEYTQLFDIIHSATN